jgi:transglutaminase-like putative cysteine protease
MATLTPVQSLKAFLDRLPRLRLQPTRFRLMDILVLAAAAAVVVQAPLSVVEAGWVPHLENLPRLAVAGLLAGYLVERTRLPGAIGLPFAILLGVEAIILEFTRAAPDGSTAERVDWLGARFGTWLETVAGGGVSNDPVVFAMAMTALAWLLGLITAWLLFRDNAPWLAVLFNGFALLMNLSYAPSGLVGYVTSFAFFSCLLLAAQQLASRTELWRRAQLAVNWRIVANVALGTAIAAGALLSIAWALPSNVSSIEVANGWNRATSPWQSLEGEFDRWFAALNPTDRTARGLTFGRTLAPRGAFNLGDTPVLQVRSSGPLYLRAATADRYAGQAITSSETTSVDIEANADFLTESEIPQARAAVQATIKVLASRTTVAFAPEAPLRLSLPAQVDTRGTPLDVASVRLTTPIQQNQDYSVVSAFSTATTRDLRGAGEDYPDWVEEHHLQLPRRVSRQIVEAGRDATRGATSAYDKAVAIENYLRDSFTYSTQVPTVPPDRDWVEYFLFESKQGYCDYFATAMVILLRTQGVPARIAAGFAPGELDESTGVSTVRENHAHSWVEVYFPRYGWILFEPSSIRPLPTRVEEAPEPLPVPDVVPQAIDDDRLTLEEIDELLAMQSGSTSAPPERPFLTTWLGVGLLVLLGALVLAGIVAAVIAVAWRTGMHNLVAYQRPYAQILRLGSWIGTLRPLPSDTPFEVAESLSRQVPGAGSAIRGVTTAYVEGTYAGRPPGSDPWPEWLAARRDVLNGMLRRRLRRWLGDDSGVATAPRSHPELLRRWGAARSRGWAEETTPPEETPRS